MDKEKLIICRCEEITDEEIRNAVRCGARTIKDIRLLTRAGMGLCQGRTCEPLIRRIIAEETKKNQDKFTPATHRPPVRPIELSSFNED